MEDEELERIGMRFLICTLVLFFLFYFMPLTILYLCAGLNDVEISVVLGALLP
jgi:hypothetical protein